MLILGLDISTVDTGWAIMNYKGRLLYYGSIKPDKSNLNEAGWYFYITHSLIGIMRLYRPSELVVEDTFFGKNVKTLKNLSRIAGQVMYVWFQFTGKSPYFYHAKSARKSLGISGSSSKHEILTEVNKKFKLRNKLKDDNIADAIVVVNHHIEETCKKKGRKYGKKDEPKELRLGFGSYNCGP